jgi:hypothetical protein
MGGQRCRRTRQACSEWRTGHIIAQHTRGVRGGTDGFEAADWARIERTVSGLALTWNKLPTCMRPRQAGVERGTVVVQQVHGTQTVGCWSVT